MHGGRQINEMLWVLGKAPLSKGMFAITWNDEQEEAYGAIVNLIDNVFLWKFITAMKYIDDGLEVDCEILGWPYGLAEKMFK